jgi:hypothetical protein
MFLRPARRCVRDKPTAVVLDLRAVHPRERSGCLSNRPSILTVGQLSPLGLDVRIPLRLGLMDHEIIPLTVALMISFG